MPWCFTDRSLSSGMPCAASLTPRTLLAAHEAFAAAARSRSSCQGRRSRCQVEATKLRPTRSNRGVAGCVVFWSTVVLSNGYLNRLI